MSNFLIVNMSLPFFNYPCICIDSVRRSPLAGLSRTRAIKLGSTGSVLGGNDREVSVYGCI